MEKDNNYIDESHPEAKKHGRTTYRDKRTGEIIEHDAATPGKPGHGGRDHYHIRNPKSTGDDDKYLDSDGNPTGKNSDSSHIYPKEG
ncbi:MAG: hypothetical protein SP4CHLAM5_11460 [Chlamydiia bacterium]|nr:hypothetical protein [Chlamydiia bacterium]